MELLRGEGGGGWGREEERRAGVVKEWASTLVSGNIKA